MLCLDQWKQSFDFGKYWDYWSIIISPPKEKPLSFWYLQKRRKEWFHWFVTCNTTVDIILNNVHFIP